MDMDNYQNLGSQQGCAEVRSLHCPKCKSTQLSPVGNDWVCHNCSHKFRNLHHVKEELSKETTARNAFCFSSIFFGVMTIALIFLLYKFPELLCFLGFPTFLLSIAVFVVLIYWIAKLIKVSELQNECKYLETNCFN